MCTVDRLTVLRAEASFSKSGKAAAESELDATKTQLDLLADEAATKTRTISKLQGTCTEFIFGGINRTEFVFRNNPLHLFLETILPHVSD